jgi:phage baseplate assembly protein W
MAINQPFGFDATGRTIQAADADHLLQDIETLMFTRPGERVNRPDLGSGLFQLVFAAGGSELATATQYLVQAALQRWLGSMVQVLAIEVSAEEATLTVQIRYLPAGAQQPLVAAFSRPAPL